MAATIKRYGLPVRPVIVNMPTPGGTTASDPFEVPQSARGINVFMGDLGSGVTWKIQVLTPPNDIENDTEVWTDMWTVSLPTTTPAVAVQMSGFARNQTTSIPATMIGGGVYRIVATADQSGAPFTFKITFGVGGF
jgi:hypothetical protein